MRGSLLLRLLGGLLREPIRGNEWLVVGFPRGSDKGTRAALCGIRSDLDLDLDLGEVRLEASKRRALL